MAWPGGSLSTEDEAEDRLVSRQSLETPRKNKWVPVPVLLDGWLVFNWTQAKVAWGLTRVSQACRGECYPQGKAVPGGVRNNTGHSLTANTGAALLHGLCFAPPLGSHLEFLP